METNIFIFIGVAAVVLVALLAWMGRNYKDRQEPSFRLPPPPPPLTYAERVKQEEERKAAAKAARARWEKMKRDHPSWFEGTAPHIYTEDGSYIVSRTFDENGKVTAVQLNRAHRDYRRSRYHDDDDSLLDHTIPLLLFNSIWGD